MYYIYMNTHMCETSQIQTKLLIYKRVFIKKKSTHLKIILKMQYSLQGQRRYGIGEGT